MKELKDGIRSLVRIDFEGRVHKQFRGTDADKRFANEVAVLTVLEERGAPNVPILLDSDEETLSIVTTNCGAPAPLVTAEKATALFKELEEKYGVRHDDPEPRNVTYSQKLGRFCLIDFELSEVLPEPGGDGQDESSNASFVLRAGWFASSIRGEKHVRLDQANDDSFLILTVNPERTERFQDEGEILFDPSHLVLAVSDGMGGKKAGEFASRLLMARIRQEASRLYRKLADEDEAEAALDRLLRDSHHDLIGLAEDQDQIRGMGATLTMAWVTHEKIFWAHVGDSRLYIVRGDEVEQLTRDDCHAWHRFQRGEITEYAYRNHPRKAILSDVLGGSPHEPFPQVGWVPVAENQRLMLCSDGIMDGLWEKDIRAMLTEEGGIHETAEAMSARARKNDGSDDTTILLAEIAKV